MSHRISQARRASTGGPSGLAGTAAAAAILSAIVIVGPPSPAAAQISADELSRTGAFRVVRPCPESDIYDDVVVCGRRNAVDRFRLPLVAREAPPSPIGDVPRASAEPVTNAECGIFSYHRRCTRAEMAEIGYYDGRDPLNFIARVADEADEPE